VTALTQTCPSTVASGGPYAADSWADLHPGLLRYATSAPQTISSSGGDPSVAMAFDPIAGGGACATAPATDERGTATYALPKATGSGFTMIGAPEVIAKLNVSGQFPEIAERLLDVGPDGTETLVARGVYRPADTSKPVIFQLHPGAWHFAAGHHPKLELLGRDAPYVRASNGSFTIDVASLTLLLPTRETAGNGIAAAHGAPIPAGAKPAPRSSSICRVAQLKPHAKRRPHRHARHAAAPRRHAARRHSPKKTGGVRACKRSPAHHPKHRARASRRRYAAS
jgi:predicted acyl esterase